MSTLEPTTWLQCQGIWENSRKRKLANNTYLERDTLEAGENRGEVIYHVRLHATRVVTFHPNGNVWLDSGGWRTVTTKERFNRYLPHGYGVWSDGGVWYLGTHDNAVAYADGITINPDGSVSGQGPDPNKTKRERKRVLKYASAFASAFVAGDIPAPNGGDCWGCFLFDRDSKKPTADHLREHLSPEEWYLVPSLLWNAAQRYGSKALLHDLSVVWSDSETGRFYREDSLQAEIKRVVRRWVLSGLGMTA